MENTILNKINSGEIDFFKPQPQKIWDELERLKKIQLLEVIGKLNLQMVESLKNWEGG